MVIIVYLFWFLTNKYDKYRSNNLFSERMSNRFVSNGFLFPATQIRLKGI
jgi:hypothetical protein